MKFAVHQRLKNVQSDWKENMHGRICLEFAVPLINLLQLLAINHIFLLRFWGGGGRASQSFILKMSSEIG